MSHCERRRAVVLDEDPELAELVPRRAAADRAAGEPRGDRRHARRPLGRARSTPTRRASGYGLLVLDGVLVRRVGYGGRFGAELLAAGDLLRPWEFDSDETLGFETTWRVLARTRLAVLDAPWTERMARYTQVGPALAGRALVRSRRLAAMMAIAQQPRLDERLWMLFWELADRHGRVHPDGVYLDLPLTHEVLSHLVAARRPSVSGALTKLAAQGRVRREGAPGCCAATRRGSTSRADAAPARSASARQAPRAARGARPRAAPRGSGRGPRSGRRRAARARAARSAPRSASARSIAATSRSSPTRRRSERTTAACPGERARARRARGSLAARAASPRPPRRSAAWRCPRDSCSALTPKNSSTMPPIAITAAPMKKPIATWTRSPVSISFPNRSGPGDAADRGADGVEERDRQRARLHREDLRHGQVGRARARRGEEERRQQQRHEAPRAERAADEQDVEHDEHDGRAEVGAGDHRLAPDGVEQPPEQQRPEEVADREERDVERHRAGRRCRRTRPGTCRGRT